MVNYGLYKWINQNSIVLIDVSEPGSPKIITEKKIIDLVIGHPLLLPNNRMIVLETYDNVRIGCNVFDISNNNIKRGTKGLFKNNCIKGFSLNHHTLYIAHLDYKKIDNDRKYKTYLSKINFSEDLIVEFTKELPFIEVYGDDSSSICWLGVNNDDEVAILLGNGDIHKFRLS